MTPRDAWSRLLAGMAPADRVEGEAVFERLPGGALNDVWSVQIGPERFVLRVPGPRTRDLGLDRRSELAILAEAGPAGLGPMVVAADPDTGLLLTRWLPGRVLDVADLQDPGLVAAAASLLGRIHRLSVAGLPPPDLAAVARRYARAGGCPESPLLRQVLEMLEKLDPGEVVPCHYDPTPANFVLTGDGNLRLVDWEYARPGSRWFDLAALADGVPGVHYELLLRAYGHAAGGLDECRPRRLVPWLSLYRAMAELWAAAAAAVAEKPDKSG